MRPGLCVLVMQAQENPQGPAKGKGSDPVVALVNTACSACHALERVSNKKADSGQLSSAHG